MESLIIVKIGVIVAIVVHGRVLRIILNKLGIQNFVLFLHSLLFRLIVIRLILLFEQKLLFLNLLFISELHNSFRHIRSDVIVISIKFFPFLVIDLEVNRFSVSSLETGALWGSAG